MMAAAVDVCGIRGRLLNVTTGECLVLTALKEDGEILPREAAVVGPQSAVPLRNVYLLAEPLGVAALESLRHERPEAVDAALRSLDVTPALNPAAADALAQADLIIYSVGTAHSSLFPSYLTNGLAEVIAANHRARKVVVTNLRRDHEIQSETANSLVEKTLYFLRRRDAVSVGDRGLVTDVFAHEPSLERADDQGWLRFTSWIAPRDVRVNLIDWESHTNPGRHSGPRVLQEILQLSAPSEEPTMPRDTLSIIVPAYNEERFIGRLLDRLLAVQLDRHGLSAEILVVDDGSTDRTAEIAAGYPGVRVIRQPRNQGKGAAVRRGIAEATGRWILIQDADLEYDPEDIHKMVSAAINGEFQAVYGSRNLRAEQKSRTLAMLHGKKDTQYWGHYLGGVALSLATFGLYGRFLTDTVTGYKLFDAALLKRFDLRTSGFELDHEITANVLRDGVDIFEVPVSYQPRSWDEGKKIRARDGFIGLWTLLRCRLVDMDTRPADAPRTSPARRGPAATAARISPWLLLAAIGGYLASAAAIGPDIGDVLIFLACLAAFTAPGWPLARWVIGGRPNGAERAGLALFLGYVVGALVFCLLRLVHVTAPAGVLIVVLVVAWELNRLVPRNAPAIVELPTFGSGDRVAVALLTCLVLVIVGPVFAHVGARMPQGLAYRAYFTADLFAHMSVVAELAHRHVPPVNPYLPTETLPDYWAYFSLPAVFSGLRPALGFDRGILQTDLAMAVVLVAVWYTALRALGISTVAAAVSWAAALGAASFEGAWFLWSQWMLHRPLGDFRYVNIDGLTRWFRDMPPVDGLHRIFWYTPQHAMALTMGLLVIVSVTRARESGSLRRGGFEALLLGAAVAFSSFNGLLFIAWYGVAEIVLLLGDRLHAMARWLLGRAVAAVACLAAVAVTLALGMVHLGTAGSLYYRPNLHLARGPWTFAVMSFGPLLFTGVAGLTVLRRRQVVGVALWLMVIVSVLTLSAVEVRGHLNSYVPFRTGQVLLVILAIGTGYALDSLADLPRAARTAAWAVLLVAFAAATPTAALDWYNARDISNDRDTGFGFHWTTYVNDDELAALHWIHSTVELDDTVNTDPEARGRGDWALIPAFAGRRMGIGFGLFEPNPERFRPEMARVAEAFRTTDADTAYDILRQERVQYLFIGAPERDRYGVGIRKFAARPDRFQMVFSRGLVTIYHLVQ